MSRILDRIENKIGMFWGVGVAPDPGTSKAVLTADMPPAEVTDTTNWVRVQIWADFGAGPKFMSRGLEWHGGPGQTPLKLEWQFDPQRPPLLVYGVLENGTRGNGSPAIAGLKLDFS